MQVLKNTNTGAEINDVQGVCVCVFVDLFSPPPHTVVQDWMVRCEVNV